MPFNMSRDTAQVVGARAEAVKNRSLFADRFPEFPDQPEDKTARSRTIKHLIEGSFEEGPACTSRRTALASLPGAQVEILRLGGRMIVNHAGGVIENAGLALDRHGGVPFIPGSTLKGIARAGAALKGAKPEEVALVFGWADSRNPEPDLPTRLPVKTFGGTVAFLPAYPTGRTPLERDIVTVHHHRYYRGEQSHPRAYDNEQPIPNEFPVVKADAEFQFIVAPVNPGRASSMKSQLGLPDGFDPVARAREWLRVGVMEHGVGAKTGAGYGWFTDKKAIGKPGPVGAAPQSIGDYNDKILASVVKLADNKGLWKNLRKEVEKLKKPENLEWLAKFRLATSGGDYKELRKQEWYPK